MTTVINNKDYWQNLKEYNDSINSQSLNIRVYQYDVVSIVNIYLCCLLIKTFYSLSYFQFFFNNI